MKANKRKEPYRLSILKIIKGSCCEKSLWWGKRFSVLTTFLRRIKYILSPSAIEFTLSLVRPRYGLGMDFYSSDGSIIYKVPKSTFSGIQDSMIIIKPKYHHISNEIKIITFSDKKRCAIHSTKLSSGEAVY